MESVLHFQALWESVLTVTTGLLSHYCVPAAVPGTGMERTQPCPCSQSVSPSVNKRWCQGVPWALRMRALVERDFVGCDFLVAVCLRMGILEEHIWGSRGEIGMIASS